MVIDHQLQGWRVVPKRMALGVTSAPNKRLLKDSFLCRVAVPDSVASSRSNLSGPEELSLQATRLATDLTCAQKHRRRRRQMRRAMVAAREPMS
jgi:hypothetical protein